MRVPGQGRGPGFTPPAGKLKLSTVARLFGLILRDNKWRIAVVLLCILVSTLATLASTLFTKTLLDDYVVPMIGQASPDYSPLAIALVKLAAVLIIGMGASYLHSILTVYISQGTLKTLRHNLFEHMERLPLSYFDSRSHGDIMSVYTNDVDTLRQVIGQTIPRLFQSLVTVISTFVSMIVLSIPLSVISIVMAVIMYIVTRKLGTISKRYFKKRQEMLGKVNGFIEEMVSGQRVVKVYCHEQKAIEQFSALNEELRSSVYNAAIALSALSGWFFCGLNGSVLTLGTLVAFLTLHKNFTRPVTQISNEINSIVMASVGSDRVYDLMDQKVEVNEGKVTLEKTGDCQWCWKTPEGESIPLKGQVSLTDVDFSYVEGKQVLFDINLTAYPGQKIAFVGGTGAGKTTITNLINRFYEIQDGKIVYDGLDVRDIEKDSLRKSLGIVLQETHLFTGRVIDNIRYGRLDATDVECIEAAKLVCAHNFIRRLPFGYDTIIDADGGNLSQGERQLLAIARAAVAAPPVLILDEATSSIDTRTEKLIQQGMDELMKGRTTFVIAHRLSTILNADYIMVMDHGRIIERGKHNELLAQKGKYYELFTGNQL